MAPPSLHAWAGGETQPATPNLVALGPQVSTQQPMGRGTWRTRGQGPRRLRGLQVASGAGHGSQRVGEGRG